MWRSNGVIREVILGLENPIEWVGSVKGGKEDFRWADVLIVLARWRRWWRLIDSLVDPELDQLIEFGVGIGGNLGNVE